MERIYIVGKVDNNVEGLINSSCTKDDLVKIICLGSSIPSEKGIEDRIEANKVILVGLELPLDNAEEAIKRCKDCISYLLSDVNSNTGIYSYLHSGNSEKINRSILWMDDSIRKECGCLRGAYADTNGEPILTEIIDYYQLFQNNVSREEVLREIINSKE